MDDNRRDQIAAYVLGALDDPELHEFEVHLATCHDCRDEVDSLRGVTGALAAAAPPAKAPRSIRDAVMAEVRAEAEVMKAAGAGADRPPRRWNLGRISLRPALAAAGATAVCAAAAVGFVAGSNGGTDTKTTSAQVTRLAGANASARVESRGSEASLHVAGLREPGTGRVYQVWVLKPGQRSPTATHALFTVDQDGRGVVDLPKSASHGRSVLVTSELDGGSITGVPSRPPVLSARL